MFAFSNKYSRFLHYTSMFETFQNYLMIRLSVVLYTMQNKSKFHLVFLYRESLSPGTCVSFCGCFLKRITFRHWCGKELLLKCCFNICSIIQLIPLHQSLFYPSASFYKTNPEKENLKSTDMTPNNILLCP